MAKLKGDKEKFPSIILRIFESVFAVLGVFMTIIFFVGSVFSGFISLLSAIIVSPIFEKVPILLDKPKKRILLQFGSAFVLFVIAALLFTSNSEDKKEQPPEDSISITTTAAELTTTTDKATTTTTTTTKPVMTSTTTETTTTITTTEQTTTTTEELTTTTVETTAELITEAPTESETEPITEAPVESEPTLLYFILNTETGCLHIDEGCRAAENIEEENRSILSIYEEEIANYSGTYWACGICSKKYKEELPKPE